MVNNQEQARQALVGIVKMNITKYCVLQKTVNDMLSDGRNLAPTSKKNKKKGKCGFCLIDSLLTKMALHQDTAGEAAKTYKLLFNGEELDMDAITEECANSAGFIKRKKGSSSIIEKDNVIMPEDAPEEIKDICDAIHKVLRGNGKEGEISIEVVNMKASNYGLDPENFDSFGDYARAVSKAREEAHAMENGDKTAEEVITDAIIKKVENEHFDENKHATEEKLN